MDTSQNSPPAISDLSVNIPSGEMSPSLVRSLHTMILNPNIEYAMSADRCPVIDPFCAIVNFLVAKLKIS